MPRNPLFLSGMAATPPCASFTHYLNNDAFHTLAVEIGHNRRAQLDTASATLLAGCSRIVVVIRTGASGLRPRIIGIALWAAAFAWAQNPPPAQDQKNSDQKDQGQQNQDQAQQEEQTYAGPSIISRDKSLIGERGGKLIDFRFYADVTGVYDSGLTPLAVDPQGNVPGFGAYGVEAGFGVVGSRTWVHDKLSVDYRGAYRYYTNHTYFNGTDQFLNLAYSHLLSRHITLDLKETAGTTSLANGAFSYTPLTNTDQFAVPVNELFDVRTNFLQSRVDLVWQKSARLSFGVGGQGFIVRRSSLALAGLNGYSARANVAYRITKRQTYSGSYEYTYFDFQRQFGFARMQTATLGYSLGLSRKWDFSMQAGGIRVESSGLTQVALDPAIAAIVGQNVAVVTYFRVIYAPMIEGRLIRRFDRSALNVSYSMGVTPGDGVYLTSKQNVGSVGYSYTGYHRLAANLSASYGTMSAVGQTLGQLTNFQASAGGTYKLGRATHLEMRYDYRHYTTQNSFYLKNSSRVTLGLAFSPGTTPLAIF